MSIAIIGGSGLSRLPELTIKDEVDFETPWGKPSAVSYTHLTLPTTPYV